MGRGMDDSSEEGNRRIPRGTSIKHKSNYMEASDLSYFSLNYIVSLRWRRGSRTRRRGASSMVGAKDRPYVTSQSNGRRVRDRHD